MSDFEFAKIFAEAYQRKCRAAEGKQYLLKAETVKTVREILDAVPDTERVFCSFDGVENAVDIRFEAYAFDNYFQNLALIFALSDVGVVDALSDGMVCIELRILDAAECLGGN